MSPVRRCWFHTCVTAYFFVGQDSRTSVTLCTACSALRAIPSLRLALTAFGGYVLIVRRFLYDVAPSAISSAELRLAYPYHLTTIFVSISQRFIALRDRSLTHDQSETERMWTDSTSPTAAKMELRHRNIRQPLLTARSPLHTPTQCAGTYCADTEAACTSRALRQSPLVLCWSFALSRLRTSTSWTV